MSLSYWMAFPLDALYSLRHLDSWVAVRGKRAKIDLLVIEFFWRLISKGL
jgi:hypothetical protein